MVSSRSVNEPLLVEALLLVILVPIVGRAQLEGEVPVVVGRDLDVNIDPVSNGVTIWGNYNFL